MPAEREQTYDLEFKDLFVPRIDRLVESALQVQAQEQKMLLDTVQTAQKELKSLRELLERRDHAVIDALEARLSGVAAEGSIEKLGTLVEGLGDGPDPEAILAPVGAYLEGIRTTLEGMGERLGALERALGRLDPWKPALEVQRALSERLAELSGSVKEQIQTETASTAHRIEAAKTLLATDSDEKSAFLVEQVRASTRTTSQELQAKFDEVAAVVDGASGDAKSHLDSKAAALTDRLRGLREGIEGAARERRELSERIASHIEQSSAATAAQIAASSDSLKEVIVEGQRASEEVRDALRGVKSDVKQAVDTGQARSFDRLIKVQDELEQLKGETAEVWRKVEESVSEGLKADQARASALSRQMNELRREVSEDLGSLISRVSEHTEQMNRDLFQHMEGFHRALIDRSETAVASVAEAVTPFGSQLKRLSARVKDSNQRITESSTRVESLYESLLDYLSRRDEILEHARDQAFLDVIEKVTENLRRRDRLGIAESLKRADQARKDRRDAQAYRKLMSEPGPPAAKTRQERPPQRISAAEAAPRPQTPVHSDPVPPGAEHPPPEPPYDPMFPSEPLETTGEVPFTQPVVLRSEPRPKSKPKASRERAKSKGKTAKGGAKAKPRSASKNRPASRSRQRQ
jgi:ABC-type transporter Mla subunit MlaD